MRKFMGIVVFLVVLVIGGLVYWYYFNVFGEGVKSGELNYLVRKGNIFKTFEGKLIQSGLRSRQPGSVQSYEFEFSVERKDIADRLMTNAGKEFDLHYKEYRSKLPWRGFSVFVVDSILAMREIRR
ncbi:MAG TPA: hypothetical protein VEZ17_08005 [Chitinophagaceae bacterium]|nr:hypothetical protein [Chitinophagaceae bacterium]